ncbi:MAG: class I SAM-dependent methyltransferase [Magnetococcales bacterium]|nr:class I SAM-dependent methyltransferase [Magnetococcales bacterium]
MPMSPHLDPHLVALLGHHLPTGPARILEIGCGTGQMGAQAKARDPRLVWHGIEVDPAPAWQAKSRLDRLFTLDIERDGPPDLDAPYDCILLNDTLTRL